MKRERRLRKMRIFIGQAVTGENISRLKRELSVIYSALENVGGHTCYDTLRDGPKELLREPKRKRLEYAFKKIDESDAFLAIVRTERKSEGMLMEFSYAFSQGKKLILAVKGGVNTSLREVADKVIEYEDSSDLIRKLEGVL